MFRAQNSGRSTVRPRWPPFVRINFWFAGHFDPTRITSHLEKQTHIHTHTGCLPFTQKVSQKPGYKVNGTRLFRLFKWKISGSNGTSEKVVLFPGSECFKRKFVCHFFKAFFHTSSRLSRPFWGVWNRFVQMVNAILGWNLPALNFAYHLPKPWTDRFAHVNSKQPFNIITFQENKHLFSLYVFACYASTCKLLPCYF